MKRFLTYLALALVALSLALSITAYRYEPRICEGVAVGRVSVGGLLADEAAARLRLWWEAALEEDVQVTVRHGKLPAQRLKVADLGVALDAQGTLSQLPRDAFWDRAAHLFGIAEPKREIFAPIFVPAGEPSKALVEYARRSIGGARPARVRLISGEIVREREVSGFEVNVGALAAAAAQAILGNGTLEVPLTESAKRVPDAELDKIVGVVSEFGTKFPANQHSRNANLRIATQKLDGVVIMPGEEFSFNKVVGARTIGEGYRLAGIYRNGRHDLGIGGGICQVSGTLYNAALLANLKITRRSNHSMPVPYLPVGRDATVDFHGADFRFVNNMDSPIAISAEYAPGMLRYRILGVPDPSAEVKIVTSGHRSWSRGVKYIDDPTLKPGQQKVIEKGSAGHSVVVHRVVYRNGVEISREALGRSHYGGGEKIVARGPTAAEPKPAITQDPFAPIPPP